MTSSVYESVKQVRYLMEDVIRKKAASRRCGEGEPPHDGTR